MKPKSIMIQGTGLSVGKSLIVTGLCRVFMQDGHKVIPFKSQNIAQNPYITVEGKEMARSQAIQAEASGILPDVRMNPILLKPTCDSKLQVIIKGMAYANMSSYEYNELKPNLLEMVKNVYGELSLQNDIIVIEGAGSPVEINLRNNDIANMGMAEISDSKVLLVGDYGRGGVFASIAGTMQLLTEEERKRVKGIIINKFKGDINAFKPELEMLEDIIKVPVLGVLPYSDIDIEDEDSLAERFKNREKAQDDIEIAIIRLPHISNFTDFIALENIEGVKINYVYEKSQMENPDLIIIPGTKNTIDDLLYIRNNGLEERINELNRHGVNVLGVCGGFQMLGSELVDSQRSESELGYVKGMGLLDMSTTLKPQKATTQVEACFCNAMGIFEGLSDISISGYEINMGCSDFSESCYPVMKLTKVLKENADIVDGVRNAEATVFGTYIHGIFDNNEFSLKLINNLRMRKGLGELESNIKSFSVYKDEQYNNISEILRKHLDLNKIYEIMME